MSEKFSMIKPYEGDRNYIFISYSHADSSRVFPLLKKLKENGFRIWYDEGIDPGSEWPEAIANHLNGCKVLLAFLSNKSINSNNCRREINYALSLDKEFLSVALEPVEMTPGMQMQISSYQSLLSYKYPTQEDFEDKLMSLEILQSCREVVVHEVQDTKFDFVEDFNNDKQETAETEEIREEETPKVEKKQLKEEKKAEKKQQKAVKKQEKTASVSSEKKSPNKLLLIGLVVIALIGLIIFIPKGTSPSNPVSNVELLVIGDKTYKNDLSVFFNDISFTSEQLKILAGYDQSKYLYFTRCSFPENGLNGLSEMNWIKGLEFENCTGINNLSFISEYEELTDLKMDGCNLTDAMLEGVTVAKADEISLNNNKLTTVPRLGSYRTISMDNNELKDLSGMDGVTTVEKASFSGNQITDISGLSGNEKLYYLNLNDNNITDISVLEPFVYLKKLYLRNNDIEDSSPLRYTSVLEELNLSNNSKISDISFIKNSSATLKVLSICGIDASGIDFFNALNKIEELWISNCNLEDISFVSAMPSLIHLNASDNHIGTITSLKNLTGLKTINLANNEISSLAGIPTVTSTRVNLLLNGNKLKSLIGLPYNTDMKYSIVTLYNNPLTNTSVINNCDGYSIIVDMNGQYDPAGLKNFTRVYALNKDLSLQVAWESALGTSRLQYKTVEEAWAESVDSAINGDYIYISY